MVSSTIISAAMLFGGVLAQKNDNSNNGADSTTLLADAIQTGSFFDGSQALGSEDGQAKAQTSQNNFINFCSGQTLTNGLQILDGSCNGIPMGQIPAKNNMITTIILNPKNGDQIQSGKDFTIQVQTNGLVAGAFTNADATYYSSPQFLQNGKIVGHTHVTVQDLGNSLNPTVPPDPTQFAFFKGINDAGNGNGLLSADVTGGLPPGNYRVCTLTASANHQPVIMPVAQRGSQDDCSKFTVIGNNDTTNANANNGATGIQAAANAASAVALGPGAIVSASAAADTASASDAANAQNNNNNNNQGNQNKNNQNNNAQNNNAQNNNAQNNNAQNNNAQNNNAQNNNAQNNNAQNNNAQNNNAQAQNGQNQSNNQQNKGDNNNGGKKERRRALPFSS